MPISVIIPTFNRAQYLKLAIESIGTQTIRPIEIIIGDDSTDNVTENLISELKIQSNIPIQYYHNNPPLKQTKNVQSLFEKAKGDYLLLLHDDDELLPNSLELLLDPLKQFPEVLASFGKQSLIDENGKELKSSEQLNNLFYRSKEREGIVDGYFAGSVSMFPNDCYLVRKNVALEIGYFDNNRAGKAADFYFGFRLGKLQKPFYFVNEYTAKYRRSPDASSLKSDSAYQALKILLEDCKTTVFPNELQQTIKRLMPIAITIAIDKKDLINAKAWLFSKHYRWKLCSPRGIKRVLLLILAYCSNKN